MERFSTDHLQALTGKARELATKIKEKEVKIGIAGLGYVGLPIALEFAKKGFECLGIDVSAKKVDMLNRGENYIEDLADAEIREVVESGLLRASTQYEDLAGCEVIFIAVPTPFNENKDPDIRYILQAGEGIAQTLSPGKLVILKSTTFPGTTEDHLIPVLNQSGFMAGVDYHIAFSPERVDPGNKVFHTGNTPIVVGGLDQESAVLASWVNNQIIEQVYLVANPKVAEMEKLLENIFRSVNIALVNELALLCERMGGINIWEVVEAAGTKPFGFMKFTPGPGVGGHCIPIDPYYLSWLAREFDFETRFITLAANVNESMPYHVSNLVMKQIAQQPIALSDARILIVGASFKRNVRDLRHSPAEAIMLRLQDEGVQHIDYTDPWAPEYRVGEKTFHSVDISEDMLASYNCAVLITDHDDFDVDFIVKHSNCVIDTRNMAGHIKENREKIVLLGNGRLRERVTYHQ